MPEPNYRDLGLGLTIGGTAAIAVGAWMFMDDVQDFPEVISSTEGITSPGRHGMFRGMQFSWLPPHVHHWLWGFIALLVGCILLLLGLLLLVKAFISKT
jgi:hypothetical protein